MRADRPQMAEKVMAAVLQHCRDQELPIGDAKWRGTTGLPIRQIAEDSGMAGHDVIAGLHHLRDNQCVVQEASDVFFITDEGFEAYGR